MKDTEVRERVTRLEGMLEAATENAGALDLVQALLELYGEALARMVRGVDPKQDELVSHLLMLHDIEPPTLLQIAPLKRQVAS
jgi:Mg2+ and Co2+ transporter CorA